MIQDLSKPQPGQHQPVQSQAKKSAQKHFRVAEKDLPALNFTAELVASPEDLQSLSDAWERLIEMSVRPNPFFDPDYLIPALSHLAGDDVSVLVVKAPQRIDENAPEVICALIPLQRKRFYGMPVTCFEIWKHDQCFDCTPLIRRDCAPEVLEFALKYLGETQKAGFLSLDTVAGEGEFSTLLTENLHTSNRNAFYRDRFTRACFKPSVDAETYINTNVSRSTRKGTQRLARKLAQQGEVKTEFSRDYCESRVEQFLSMELESWKGKSGTAFASNEKSEAFFREVAFRMLGNQKMTMSQTFVGERPVAISCDLLQQGRAAHYKITFDETLRDFSPGLILELENISTLHSTGVSFVDSCADPNHSMINRVWSDRTELQSLVIALNGTIARFAVSAMPMIQQLSKLIRKKG